MNKPKIYLAHNSEHRIYVAKEIQPRLKLIGIEVINPFQQNNNLPFNKYFREGMSRKENLEELEGKHLDTDIEKIVNDDLKNILNADGLFGVLINEGTGTPMEIFYNSFHLCRGKQKTFVYAKEPLDRHTWLRHLSTVSNNLDYIIKKIEQRYIG